MGTGTRPRPPDEATPAPAPSVQPEHPVDRLDLRRLDQLGMRNSDGDQRPVQLRLPESEEILQRGKVREQIVVLPDVGAAASGDRGAGRGSRPSSGRNRRVCRLKSSETLPCGTIAFETMPTSMAEAFSKKWRPVLPRTRSHPLLSAPVANRIPLRVATRSHEEKMTQYVNQSQAQKLNKLLTIKALAASHRDCCELLTARRAHATLPLRQYGAGP